MSNVAAEDSAKQNDAAHVHTECAMISEKQFMRDHTIYSAISSWLFAIAGATNIGVLCAFSAKVLSAAEQGKPIFRSKDPAIPHAFSNKKYNMIAIGMTALGAMAMAVSNWLESKKVVTEWQLGAGKLQRKASVAENKLEHAEAAQSSPKPCAQEKSPEACKEWVSAIRPKANDPVERIASRLRHG
jgi:hypothetical protein